MLYRIRGLLLGCGVGYGYQIGDLLFGHRSPVQQVLLLAELDETVELLVHIPTLRKSVILHPLKSGVK